jgi:hypothetical protein
MDIHIYIYILLCVIITIVGFTTWNILRKYENATDSLLESEDKLIDIKRSLAGTLDKMKEIDRKQMFESDDDVGQIFKQLKDLIDELDRGV